MNAKWWKTIAVAEAILMIAGLAFWFVPKVLYILGDHGKAVLSPSQMELDWRTCPNYEIAGTGQLLRVVGKVTTLVGANVDNGDRGGYWVASNGASIPIAANPEGLAPDSLPAMNTVVFVLGRYIGDNADNPDGHIEEILRFPLDGSMGGDDRRMEQMAGVWVRVRRGECVPSFGGHCRQREADGCAQRGRLVAKPKRWARPSYFGQGCYS